MGKKYVTLDAILNADNEELNSMPTGEYATRKLGLVPWEGLNHAEIKQIKKDCMVPEKDGTGGIDYVVDEDKVHLRMIAKGVEKDKRSDFSFNDKALMEKMGVKTADQLVTKLLDPGEIFRWALEMQEAMGYGERAAREQADAVKNLSEPAEKQD